MSENINQEAFVDAEQSTERQEAFAEVIAIIDKMTESYHNMDGEFARGYRMALSIAKGRFTEEFEGAEDPDEDEGDADE